jgi:hypothetical protein
MIKSIAKIPLQRRVPPVPGDIEAEMTSEDIGSPVVEAGFYG